MHFNNSFIPTQLHILNLEKAIKQPALTPLFSRRTQGPACLSNTRIGVSTNLNDSDSLVKHTVHL